MDVSDVEFHRKVIHLAAVDHIFWSTYGTLLDGQYFDTRQHQRIVFAIRKLIQEYGKEVDRVEVQNACLAVMESEGLDPKGDAAGDLKTELKEVFSSNITNREAVQDQFLNFIKKQRYRRALGECLSLLDRGGSAEDAIPVLEAAAAVTHVRSNGMTFEDLLNLPQRFREKYNPSTLVQTGFDGIDRAFGGGMAPGEVHTVQATPKQGKSTFGCNVGAFNLMKGKNVFHATLEIPSIDVLAKYGCRFTGMEYADILQKAEDEYIGKMSRFHTEANRPNLFVEHWPEKTANAFDIRSWISRVRSDVLRDTGKTIKPDLIIVDYDDCLNPSVATRGGGGGADMYEDAGTIYSDLIKLAAAFACPVLTFAQPKREAWERANKGELIYAYDLAHSAKKAHKAWSISSINFADGKDNGIFFVNYVRRGESNVKVAMTRDLKRARFCENTNAAQYEKE